MTLLERRGAEPPAGESGRPGRRWNVELSPHRIKRTELAHLSRQLAAFLRAGIPVLTALAILGEDGDSAAIKRVVGEIAADLSSGRTLTEAFDRHPKDFPVYYRRILRSAELTGNLDQVLERLATYVERDVEARRKVTAALVYPSVVLGMAAITVMILVVAVLPQFEKFFASLGVELPLTTRLLMSVTRFLASWGAVLLGVTVAVGVSTFLLARTSRGRRMADRAKLRLPVVSGIYRLVLVERFCRLMASLTRAGVPLTTGLTVTAESMGNSIYSDALVHVQRLMIEGEGLSAPLRAAKLFPTAVVQMIRVGEATGTLDEQLDVASLYYERELDHRIKQVTNLIEPAVVLVVGIVVGFVALALVSAMYGIFQQGRVS
jgi:type IV pilus assembly protein PilC